MGSLVNQWHEWICHTNFSFMIGASHPADLIARAVTFGYAGLAITDYDGVYGIARAYNDLNELKKDHPDVDLRLRYGAEIHLTRDHDLPIYFQDTIILYARTHRGYYNLCQLLSYAHRDGKTGANIPLDYLLSAPLEDIIAIQPMRGLIRRKEGSDPRSLKERYGKIQACLGGNLYFAVSRHLSKVEDKWIEPTLALASSIDAPVLISQDIFMHDRRNKDISDLLHAIRLNKTLDDIPEHLFVNSRRCPHATAALEKMYKDLPVFQSALRHSIELAETFRFDLDELTYHYPKEMIPEGFDAQTYLEHLTWTSARHLFGSHLPTKIERLLTHELSLVKTLNFADYFLTVWDIVAWARSREILCQGRGSAANSAICYVLGITSVNPDKFDLLFERFISVERGDPPDIDVDFENDRREEVIQYIYERYGRDKAAMVCNVITFKSRGALRFTGKALGVPEEIINHVAESKGTITARSQTVEEILEQVKRNMEVQDERQTMPDHTWRLWADLSQRVLYYPRFLGVHSGGFMLSDKEINWLVPQEPATMEGRTVIQWCKDDIESLNFFKIDILALGMLTAMKKCFDLIRQHHGRDLTLATIPPDDRETYQMIQRAETTGVFQIESTAQRSSLPMLKPMNFYDLVVQVAIIRPGPILAGVKHPYLRRRNGLEAVRYAHPKLEPILKRTYGTIIFQEQLMRVAMAIGNFTPGEANEIRKNIGSWTARGNIGRWVVKLTQGMVDNGISQDFIQEVLKQIQGFASYGFPESHAASFALLAYASSFLKRHYPDVFFTALLNSQPMGFYQPDTLIKTARHEGVPVLPVCVARSDWDARLEPMEVDNTDKKYAIRLGLNMVRGLNQASAESLVATRKRSRDWSGLESFLISGALPRVDLTALAAANALSVFGIDRKAAVWIAEGGPYLPEEDHSGGQISFQAADRVADPAVVFPGESELESIESDYRATGTSLRRHFTSLIKEEAWVYPIPVDQLVTTRDIPGATPDRFISVFGMVLVRQSPGTAKKMLFITLEDEYGIIQTVIRPHIYARYYRAIEHQAFMCVLGKLQKNDGAYSLLVSQVFSPVMKKADVIPLEYREKYNRANDRAYTKIRNYM